MKTVGGICVTNETCNLINIAIQMAGMPCTIYYQWFLSFYHYQILLFILVIPELENTNSGATYKHYLFA